MPLQSQFDVHLEPEPESTDDGFLYQARCQQMTFEVLIPHSSFVLAAIGDISIIEIACLPDLHDRLEALVSIKLANSPSPRIQAMELLPFDF